MSARSGVQSRMCAAIDDLLARYATPFTHEGCVEMRDLLTGFAGDFIAASEADGEDIDGVHFDDLLSSISYFQDRVSETLADREPICTPST